MKIGKRRTFWVANTSEKVILREGKVGGEQNMVAYEFYWRDETEEEHFIGILPERRKNPERISDESIINWVRKILGDGGEIKNIYFTKVDV
jgi:hypothetical protein